jgi:hypothetical protein
MTFDPADAATVPLEIRKHALRLALEAVDGYIRETGYVLDFFGRLELLDLTLDELEAEYDADLPRLPGH